MHVQQPRSCSSNSNGDSLWDWKLLELRKTYLLARADTDLASDRLSAAIAESLEEGVSVSHISRLLSMSRPAVRKRARKGKERNHDK